MYGIFLTYCMLYVSRGRTIGCKLTDFRFDSLVAYITVFGVAFK